MNISVILWSDMLGSKSFVRVGPILSNGFYVPTMTMAGGLSVTPVRMSHPTTSGL